MSPSEDNSSIFEILSSLEATGFETEDTESYEEITEPFDPTLIRVETRPFTVDLLISRIRENELDLSPGFQRKSGIWSEGQQSRLIESMLIRIPLPAFYMDATDEDHWLIVDGLQRLTTIKRFVIDKELKLVGLEFLNRLDGKDFDQLPKNFQRRIKETQLTVSLIEKNTPPEVKFNIFKRINTGGLPLSSQEIRNALNQGVATDLLKELAGSKAFRVATDHSIKDSRMGDQECVLRFLAFSLTSYKNYRSKDFDRFLNDAMAHLNKMPEKEIFRVKNKFIQAMEVSYQVFGKQAFRKIYKKSKGYRYPINKALFEAWSVNFAGLDKREINIIYDRKKEVIESFKRLMGDRDFENAISQGTGNVNKVHLRFTKVEKAIKGVISSDY